MPVLITPRSQPMLALAMAFPAHLVLRLLPPCFSVLESDRITDHINMYMHPQAVVVDGSSIEEDFFLEAMRMKMPTIGVPLIELPKSASKQLAWMTKLDSASLAGQFPPISSGVGECPFR